MHSFPLDESTADRLLALRMSPEDAPEGLAGVAALLRTAAGAAIPAEIAHEAEVVTAGIAVLSATAATGSSVAAATRRPRLSKLMTAKFAAAATVAALGLGAAAAAATGSLPGQDSNSSNPPESTTILQTTGSPVTPKPVSASLTTGSPGTNSQGSKSIPPSSVPATGPANTHAQQGLCNAFLAPHNSTSTTTAPPRDFAIAFRNLIGENDGSASATATHCQTVSNPNATENTTSQNAPKTNDNGKQSGTGNGSGTSNHPGAGNQSNAGSSSSRGQGSSIHSGVSSSAGLNNGFRTATTSGNGHRPVSGIVGKR